jgi:hypothetical protein
MATLTRDPPDPASRPHRASRRRLLPAGHVIVVMVVAALVGSVLNAPGIRKTALGQDVGFERDVARFFAEPLYDVTHALRLDAPRRALQALVGRSDDDDVDVSLPDPIVVETPTTTPTTIGAPEVFSPTNRLKVWVGGDSLAIVPGQSFVNRASEGEVVDVVDDTVDGRIATGLARPEVFNWPSHMLDVIDDDDPDVMIVTMGSNDDQTLTGDGGVGPFGTPEWIAEYRRRVGGMMDVITASGDRVLLWMGAPITRNEERSETRYRIVNDIYREEAAKRPGRVFYVDIYDRFRTPEGGYSDFIDDVQVRTPDGVHFSRAGGDRIADLLLDLLGGIFDLVSWKARSVTTTLPPASPSPTAP